MAKSRLEPVLRSLAVAAAVLLAAVTPGTSSAASPDTCGGRDLLPEIASDAAAASRIAERSRDAVNGEAMLWRVRKEGAADSHLFGTIHLSDPRVVALPAKVEAALAGARHVALEIADLSPTALGQAIGKLRERVLFVDGRSLSRMLTAEELGVVRGVVRKTGFPDELAAVARPWLVTMLMALSDCERARAQSGAQPLDFVIGAKARAQGIPLTGLETLEDQLSAMAAVPEDDQLIALRASVAMLGLTEDLTETVLARYLARETGKVWPIQIELWRKHGYAPEAFASVRRELIEKRNLKMRDAALPLLAKGGAFIAVGALHLVGGDGLVSLLRRSGYEVTAAE
jgi:uncharacterized protein YbaP (TraB family)